MAGTGAQCFLALSPDPSLLENGAPLAIDSN